MVIDFWDKGFKTLWNRLPVEHKEYLAFYYLEQINQQLNLLNCAGPDPCTQDIIDTLTDWQATITPFIPVTPPLL